MAPISGILARSELVDARPEGAAPRRAPQPGAAGRGARVLFARDGVECRSRRSRGEAGSGWARCTGTSRPRRSCSTRCSRTPSPRSSSSPRTPSPSEDAWAGFTGFLEQALAQHAANRGLKDVLASSEHGAGARRGDACADAAARCARLIERAQEQGTLRGGLRGRGHPLVFWSERPRDRGDRRRSRPTTGAATSACVLDGLRADGGDAAARPAADPGAARARGEAQGRA